MNAGLKPCRHNQRFNLLEMIDIVPRVELIQTGAVESSRPSCPFELLRILAM